LLQKEVAEILHVTEDTITDWENGRCAPQTSYIPRIISFLEYSPISYGNNLKQYRKEKGLTVVKLAKILKVDSRTITKIEGGKNAQADATEKISKYFIGKRLI
jgi:DNA-binding XRE family transcriptional regulator